MLLIALAMLATTFSSVQSADAQLEPDQDRPVRDIETLRLACAPDVIDGQRGVLCRWSEATNPNTRAYKLFKSTDGSARQLVTKVGADGRRGYFDTGVSAPSKIVYGVISVNPHGRLLGRSAPVRVHFGQDLAKLRLACAPDSIEGHRGVLCRWSEASQSGVRGYQLYRVDGDQRVLVTSIGIDGRRGYFDRDVVPGTRVAYAVAAVDRNGKVVAVGGPTSVHWRLAD